MKFDYYEYVKETNLKIGEERGENKIIKTVVMNMLRQGKSEKDIQATLGLNASQVRELIRDIQSNAQA